MHVEAMRYIMVNRNEPIAKQRKILKNQYSVCKERESTIRLVHFTYSTQKTISTVNF